MASETWKQGQGADSSCLCVPLSLLHIDQHIVDVINEWLSVRMGDLRRQTVRGCAGVALATWYCSSQIALLSRNSLSVAFLGIDSSSSTYTYEEVRSIASSWPAGLDPSSVLSSEMIPSLFCPQMRGSFIPKVLILGAGVLQVSTSPDLLTFPLPSTQHLSLGLGPSSSLGNLIATFFTIWCPSFKLNNIQRKKTDWPERSVPLKEIS